VSDVDRGPRRPRRRLASFAVYAAGPIAVLALVWFGDLGLLADTPMWLLVAIILGTGVVNLGASYWFARRPDSAFRLQFRVALSVSCTAAVIYAAGWGAVLVVAYALGAMELMRTIGPRTTRASVVWTAVAIVVGESLVAIGWAPTVIDAVLGHAIAIVGGSILVIVIDVSGRTARAAAVAESKVREWGSHYESLVEQASDIIGVISTTGTVLSVSPAVETMLGYTPEEVRGRPISMFLHPDQMADLDWLLSRVLVRAGEPLTIEIRLMHSDGTDRVIEATLTSPAVEWKDRIIVNLHDLTTQRRLEERLRHEASHDPLTGLLNRSAFAAISERVCADAAASGGTVAMLFVDLDGFKTVNDEFGHERGDAVLVATARRLQDALRGSETLARLGGDEFGVLIDGVERRHDAIAVAERILTTLSDPIPGLPAGCEIGASIGIALRTDASVDISALMREADEAMYVAKRRGRARWELSPTG
jgi:diguanylate cyclase (GGDEF)-like protein/PAS domain S-box-containing protein